ncbi:MAG: glycerophosphodiester phosphodiesterase family protein [Yoonia sp.]|jgi:glycerophosphoryl diester phosphodiesterase|nr:glycerophosphodiester phosphodiesterase family protein [Yoonia sp.]
MTLPAAFFDHPIAHRALHDVTNGRAENSTKSITAALEAGYGIEVDLQLSSDGVPMVFHDYDLGRLTHEKGPVARRTAAELTQIPLRHDGGGIPTLEQLLTQVDGRVPLLIEFKDQDGAMGPNVGPLGQAAAHFLRGYEGAFAVMSFNPHAVAELQQLLPDAPRGIVTDPYHADDWPTLPASVREGLRDIADYDPTGSCFISHNQADLSSPRVTALKSAGASILCWTVKSPAVEGEARKVADNITFEGYLA